MWVASLTGLYTLCIATICMVGWLVGWLVAGSIIRTCLQGILHVTVIIVIVSLSLSRSRSRPLMYGELDRLGID